MKAAHCRAALLLPSPENPRRQENDRFQKLQHAANRDSHQPERK